MTNKPADGILLRNPPFRKLRGYAFDPIASLDLDTAEINQIVYSIPWEADLRPGPEGAYIKIVDRDPASDAVYKPVDLNELRARVQVGRLKDSDRAFKKTPIPHMCITGEALNSWLVSLCCSESGCVCLRC